MKNLHIALTFVCALLMGMNSTYSQNLLVNKTNPAKNESSDDINTYRKKVYENPPTPDGYVNDYESLFTEDQYAQLDSMISDFEKKTTIQIALITFDTTMSCVDSLDALSLRMANSWGVGQKDKNNGVIVGICSGYGKVKILYGEGLDNLVKDNETNKIIQTDFVPYYEKDQYYEGTVNGLTALMKLLKSRYK